MQQANRRTMTNLRNNQELSEQVLTTIGKLSSEFSYIPESCCFAHITSASSKNEFDISSKLYKIEGCILIIIAQGRLHIELNADSFDVDGAAAVSLLHGAMIKLQADESEQIDAYVLIFSKPFLQDINISFSNISPEALADHDSPVMKLREREIPQLVRFMSLMHNVMSDTYNAQVNRHIISSLTSALFYQMVLLLYKHIETKTDNNIGPRRSTYVHDFMRLVHVYYTRERSVNFYASQLFISPKYLSLLVKEATGRSAAQWIDHFVITEAKNLLRYSGKNVQQVAYALNFTNQSSFGKYFKHITGMSPTEFQKQ